MKVKLKYDVPVNPAYGLTKDLVLDVQFPPEGMHPQSGMIWVAAPNGGTLVKLLRHEYDEVAEDEQTDAGLAATTDLQRPGKETPTSQSG